MDDLEAHLREQPEDDIAEVDLDTCSLCATTSNGPDPVNPAKLICFSRKSKDFYCHLVHLLLFGEMTWTDLVAELTRPGNEAGKRDFLAKRNRLIVHMQNHGDELPKGWTADPLQTISQEREVTTKTSPLGYALLYTGDSYQRTHGGRSPQDDGLKTESFLLPNGMSAVGCKVWQGPTDIFRVEVQEISRVTHKRLLDDGRVTLLSDQRTKRFDARRSLALQSSGLADLKKVPLDTVQLELHQSQHPTQPQGSMLMGASSGGVAGTEAPENATALARPEDDTQDLEAMGLQVKKGPKVKAKRTRAEMIADEISKVQEEVKTLVTSCSNLPHTPKASDLARVERMLQKRLSDFKDAADYANHTALQATLDELEALKKAVKPTVAYLLGTAPTRRKQEKDFLGNVSFLKEKFPAIYQHFAPGAKQAFDELILFKSLEDKDWAAIGKALDEASMEKLHLSAETLVEKVLSQFVKELDDNKGTAGNIEAIGISLSNVLQILSGHVKPEMKETILVISALAGVKPLEGQATLEIPMQTMLLMEKQPVYRVLHGSPGWEARMVQVVKKNDEFKVRENSELSKAEMVSFFNSVTGQTELESFFKGEALPQESKEVIIKAFQAILDKSSAVSNLLTEDEMDVKHPCYKAFVDMSLAVFNVLLPRLAKSFELGNVMFLGLETLKIDSETWKHLVGEETALLLEVAEMFRLGVIRDLLEPFGPCPEGVKQNLVMLDACHQFVSYASSLMTLIKTCGVNEDEKFAEWLERLPLAFKSLTKETQSTAIKNLKDVLELGKAGVEDMKESMVAAKMAVLAKGIHSMFAIQGPVLEKIFDMLRKSVVEDMIPSKPFFLEEMERKAFSFLPSPADLADRAPAFWLSISQQADQAETLATLHAITDLINKKDFMPDLEKKLKRDDLMTSTALFFLEVSAIVASINKVDDAPPFTPLSWATELGKISKHFLAVGEKAALHKEDRTVTEYLTNWVSPSFIYPFDKVVCPATEEAVKAIPPEHEKHIDARAIQALESTMFSRKVHEAACKPLEAVVAATAVLQSAVRTCGHLLSPEHLALIKFQEANCRTMKAYGANVQTVHTILHKFQKKNSREKAAMIRELKRAFERSGVSPSKSALVWLGNEGQ